MSYRVPTRTVLAATAAALACTLSPVAIAQDDDDAVSVTRPAADPAFARFTPSPAPVKTTRIDYTLWDDALDFFVFPMGRSIREGAPSVEPGTGTRRVYGHDSRFRMEGNRIGFSFLSDEVIASLTEYRRDLESLPDQLDITTLSRNEQLAFWINLHNVAVIEQIALNYPLSQPRLMKLGTQELPLDEAKMVTVSGVAMSPRDIREQIVYPNWSDPRIIYGFFRGDIGGPSIQREAFTARNLTEQLNKSANEFVNSLRGVEKTGRTMRVSRIYAEAAPFYFPNWPADLRTHLATQAEDDVMAILAETRETRATTYEFDIADLQKGERDPGLVTVDADYGDGSGSQFNQTRVNRAIARLVGERDRKIQKAFKRGELVGRVTVVPLDLGIEAPPPKEIE